MNQQMTTQRIVLASRPQGEATAANFRLEEAPLPPLKQGQLLVEVLFLSLDPYMRGRMDARKSYAPPVAIGAVMEGGTVARVLRSEHPDYQTGDIVLSHSGWQSHAVIDAGQVLRRLDPAIAPVSTALGVFGMPGFTAWAGLREIGRPRAGETLVVAAASGPVGATVGQIARLHGTRVVGIAGGAEKCAYLREALGFDEALDHRATNFAEQLAAACPQGIDIYFENVGGKVWQAVLPLLNEFARVPVCGLAAHYNEVPGDGQVTADASQLGPALMRQILTRSLTVRGFIQREFAALYPQFLKEMGGWLRQGEIVYREDIIDGLEQAPDAFIGLLKGRNFGKLLVRVASS